ncbi:MAG: AbrB/MazE/SpoVT family DNA-binding domain-containing protein [Balneolaceae bacterium]|nr:AbrB/MazE/SpoVT family DNA-binding domain-containing protein [Balneolaceae bacterium]
MKTKLIKVGNSKGVRIPKPMIEEAGLSDEIELILDKNRIILQSMQSSRAGWSKAFLEAEEIHEEPTTYFANDWDEEEWTW